MGEPRAEYTKRLERYLKVASEEDRVHLRLGYWKLAVLAAGLAVAWGIFGKHALSLFWLIAPIVLYAALAVWHGRVLRAKNRAHTAAEFYRKGIARIEDRWTGAGQTGERFRDGKSVYAEDLDLFGKGCLFELLSTARLPMGESRLANWLCEGADVDVIRERQREVQELRTKLDLRESLAVIGEDLRARVNPESLVEWAEKKPALPGGAMRVVTAALALAAAAAIVYYLAAVEVWPLASVLAVESGILVWLRKKAHAVTEGVDCNAEGLLLFSEILAQLEREPFDSPRLKRLAAELRPVWPIDLCLPNRLGEKVTASRAIRQFARIVYWIDASDSLLAKLSELPFLYSLQVAMAAEAWRRKYGAHLRRWAEMTGEMEALLSLAGYSYEHPADPFPEFVRAESGAAVFAGEELGHPLISEAQCVRNSVRLDEQTRVLLVSGSNMSGKSTLLRVVGINAVLAMAGAPVRARRLKLSPLKIGTRIRSTDSLQEGRSSFYTEILHIRKVFDGANGAAPLVFLFDELLEGTNSKDRRIGAESLIRGLLKRRAIGIVTTHDLALTEIGTAVGNVLKNMHFEDAVVDGKMKFDYKLRPGVVEKSNALELMRLIGLET
ncbi:MAG TPA: mismatch repair protein [Candidatus Methylomirabilis sp.]|nr:mismatch repair protein [Candidatus Methylomirabilis sp.]